MSGFRPRDTELLTLPDNRKLSYATYGDTTSPDAPVIFYFHSFPSSHHEGAQLDVAAQNHGVRLIAPDRPGIGYSTFLPQRRLLDWPMDILALADHLGIPQFAVLASSSGAPYALACYHKIPRSRLCGAGIIAGAYPKALGAQRILLEHWTALYVVPWMPSLLAVGLEWSFGKYTRAREQPKEFEALVERVYSTRADVDKAVWKNNESGIRDIVHESVREAFRESSWGPAYELKLYGADWGFDLSCMNVKKGSLVLWHGARDVNVPLSVVEKAAQMTGAELRVGPDEGHTSLTLRKADECVKTIRDILIRDSGP